MARIRVVRKGVTPTELVTVLGRRLGDGFQVVAEKEGGAILVRRSLLSAAVVRIDSVPGATVFRVRGAGMPVVSLSTSRAVANALRRSPEFRSI